MAMPPFSVYQYEPRLAIAPPSFCELMAKELAEKLRYAGFGLSVSGTLGNAMPPEQPQTNPQQSSGQYTVPPQVPSPQPPPNQSAWQGLLRPFAWIWAHLGTMGRVRLVVLLIVFAVGVPLGFLERGHHAAKPVITSSAATSGASTNPSQLSVVCGANGRAVATNDKYRSGNAPYHVAVFEQSEFYQTTHYDYSFPTDVITDPVVGPAVRPVAPSATQLVACIDRTSEASTGKSCPYQPVNLPIYSATYQLTVYEAATHRVVLQAPVGSVPLYTVRDNCPIEHEYDPKNPRIYYPVDGTGLVAALKPVVQ